MIADQAFVDARKHEPVAVNLAKTGESIALRVVIIPAVGWCSTSSPNVNSMEAALGTALCHLRSEGEHALALAIQDAYNAYCGMTTPRAPRDWPNPMPPMDTGTRTISARTFPRASNRPPPSPTTPAPSAS